MKLAKPSDRRQSLVTFEKNQKAFGDEVASEAGGSPTSLAAQQRNTKAFSSFSQQAVAPMTTFSSLGPNAATSSAGAPQQDAAALEDGTHAALAMPRKSFLLKDVMKQQPTAYQPKYVVEKSSLPLERWVKTVDHPQWSPTPNPRACTPSIVLPGAKIPVASWAAVDDDILTVQEGMGCTPHRSPTGSSKKFSLLLDAVTPERNGNFQNASQGSPLSAVRSASRDSDKKPNTPGSFKSSRPVSRQPDRIQSTPLENGVQAAWCSSFVQLGSFRNLVVYRHEETEKPIPIEVLPPEHLRLTPLEQRRVEHAQREYLHRRHVSATRGHVNSDIARTTHIGLAGGFRQQTRSPPRTLFGTSRSPTPNASASSSGGFSSSLAIPDVGHPPMHYALPRTLVLPPPPVEMVHQLPVRTLSTQKYTGPCKHQRDAAQNDGGAPPGLVCPLCVEVSEELDRFDNVRESKEDRLYQVQLQQWAEQQARDEEAKSIPPDMMRTKSGRLVKRLIILDEGPTVAQLYHGTTHEDREALYVATCGGLSFDISKERFTYLMQKVLAPRIHVRISDDQAAAMFTLFDIDGNGKVSYMEYLSALSNVLLTAAQKKFLEDVFDQLYKMPFLTGDAKQANKQYQSHQAQLQLEGHMQSGEQNSNVSVGGAAIIDAASQLLRKKSGLMRRKSSMRLDGSMTFAEAGSLVKKASMKPLVYLSKHHITEDRLKRTIYDLKQHNPWFPHPKDDALASAIVGCFAALQEEDRVIVQKFKMFILCDDACMAALEDLVPSD